MFNPFSLFRKKPVRLGCGIVALVLFLYLFNLGLRVVTLVVSGKRAKKVEIAELDRIRRTGDPITAAAMEANYDSSDVSSEATKLWYEAFETWDDGPGFLRYEWKSQGLIKKDDGELAYLPSAFPDKQEEMDSMFLEKYGVQLTKFHAASSSGGAARYKTDFSDGMNMLLPHCNKIEDATRLLFVEAHIYAYRKDSQKLSQSLRSFLMLSESLKADPVLVSQMVRYKSFAKVHELLGIFLGDVPFTEAELENFNNTLAAIEFDEGAYRGLIGERVTGIVSVDIIYEEAMEIPFAELVFSAYRSEDMIVYLKFMQKFIDASQKEDVSAIREAEEIQNEMMTFLEEAKTGKNKYYAAKLMLPSGHAYLIARAKAKAHRDTMLAAIAVVRYYRQEGRLPERLDDLQGTYLSKALLDSFNGENLRYPIEEQSVEIYSVGANRIDEGGVLYEGDDIGLSLNLELLKK